MQLLQEPEDCIPAFLKDGLNLPLTFRGEEVVTDSTKFQSLMDLLPERLAKSKSQSVISARNRRTGLIVESRTLRSEFSLIASIRSIAEIPKAIND
jgi:hypothetical protein